jgi:hypothetical protein
MRGGSRAPPPPPTKPPSVAPSAAAQVNVQALKDRSKWAAGWLSMTEVLSPEAMAGGAVCRTCAGKGQRTCDSCGGSGRLELIQL